MPYEMKVIEFGDSRYDYIWAAAQMLAWIKDQDWPQEKKDEQMKEKADLLAAQLKALTRLPGERNG